MSAPIIMVVDPAHYDVRYVINPWMRPAEWQANPVLLRHRARASFEALLAALGEAGARVEIVPGVPGQPDMVFPANAAVVLDGRAMAARFALPERQGEELPYLRALQRFQAHGLLEEVAMFPEGCFQEGAGDAIWDAGRGFFWTGYGQRSLKQAGDEIARFFDKPVVALELATARFYHLDTCFCPLSGGEVLYYPPAFTEAALEAIHAHVSPDKRMEATEDDAGAFCVNAINIGRTIVMARAPAALRGRLEARGYLVHEVDLDPFILAGGGAYCMTLNLTRASGDVAAALLESTVLA